MPIETLTIGEPFFGLRHVTDQAALHLTGRAIVVNVADRPIRIEAQTLAPLQSAIFANTALHDVDRALIIDRFDTHDDAALCAEVRKSWPSAFEVRGEERLRGVEHYMSPKVFVGNIGLTFYHSASVPLNVGLHKDHPFCPVPGFREVHTQIVGFGKMQQCRERDPATLYLEEPMAPGMTHRPMYDGQGNYPWHQYETTTPSIFMALEILPEGAEIPNLGGNDD
ncbi:hypothetical protein O2N63_17230 [Aliiroseovarius sp. KMU-50]|uniref:Uncharacterized protein n=1 Tax=Aliiroseovarius salicola TaxID=3009082 RepID=A0ABT4W5P2_9RHOB|nr:hypothetical protein [Aliiroseovarius sp. KMU-50]MDA5095836.1 hypothetical protein [Aliiroseovarius sp. KMU-50]